MLKTETSLTSSTLNDILLKLLPVAQHTREKKTIVFAAAFEGEEVGKVRKWQQELLEAVSEGKASSQEAAAEGSRIR